jgi:cytochrome bd ubiquinol oxidase subunit I
VLMLALGVWGVWLAWRKRLYEQRWFLRYAVAMGPAGFLAVLAGWIVTEVGRQPWVVYGVLRTADAVSPVPAGAVLTSLLIYISVYAVVFTAGAIFILRLLAEGPVKAAAEPQPRGRAPGSALAAAPEDVPDENEGDA